MAGVAVGIIAASVWRPAALLGLLGLLLVVAPCRLALSAASGRELLPLLKATGRAQLVVGLLLAAGLALG